MYDPIPPVSEITGFVNASAARRYLRANGFHRVPPSAGGGWSKWLPSASNFVSRFDGVERGGFAYRQNAFIRPPDANHASYWILLQGTAETAEPNPELAILYDSLNPGRFDYVRDWHLRF